MSARRISNVARLPAVPKEYDPRAFEQIVKGIEQRTDLIRQPLVDGYSVSNYTETRTLNAGTATATDVANFLATLVSDLIAAGAIKKAQ